MKSGKNTERIVKSVPYPATNRLTKKELFGSDGKPKLQVLQKHFLREGRLDEDCAIHLLQQAMKIFATESNLVQLTSPITMVGDTHGQFFDLIKLFSKAGQPDTTKFCFLGDYVDRGCFSVEVLLYLYCMKLLYPQNITLLRGNHESRQLTAHFTFKSECMMKIGETFYDQCCESFDCLPISACVDKQFICVHGGLSPDIDVLEDIKSINRFTDLPSSGPLCDMLWSDPTEDFGSETGTRLFFENTIRGCSFKYTYRAVCQFLEKNNLLTMVRAHQVVDKGCEMKKQFARTQFPSMITLFSAPNYCDAYKNKGAFLKYVDKVLHVYQFNCVPHPFYLPNMMDVFNWSLPFVFEKVTNILLALFTFGDDEEITDGQNEAHISRMTEKMAERDSALFKKISAIRGVANKYSRLRNDSEAMIKMKGLTPKKKNMFQELSVRQKRGDKTDFEYATDLDSSNERWYSQ
ncbi:hypothetical protein SNEBB_006367 [Seison nebaliae]|nr:hypothetical protein SNEBB_006367 [Seison nebaliae]